MSFLTFRRPSKSSRHATLAVPNTGPEWISSGAWREWEEPRDAVAGESHYMPALLSICGMRHPGGDGVCKPVNVTFVREPTNRYDSNAFMATVDQRLIGYLRRQIASAIAPKCDREGCVTFTLCGFLRGGADGAENIGCHVWVERRLTAAPDFGLGRQDWAVSWPPPEFAIEHLP